MAKGKIDYKQLHQLVMQGKSGNEIAKYFGVTSGAVSQAKQKLRIAVIKDVALENAHRVVDKSLNAAEQLFKINEQANKLLDELEKYYERHFQNESQTDTKRGEKKSVYV